MGDRPGQDEDTHGPVVTAISTSTVGNATAFGFSITITGSFGVVLGAAAAFGALKLRSYGIHAQVSPSQLASDAHALRTGAIHVATIAAAVGTVALVALVDAWVVWPLGGFLATLVYFVGTGAAMALHERDEQRSPPS